MIDSIYIDNFKSLKDISLRLSTLSFFCGPNGSGKSNFADAWDFLSQTFRNGLSYAVTEKGGFYNMCFRRQRRSRGHIYFRFSGGLSMSRENIVGVTYQVSFSLQTKEERIRSDFYVSSEHYEFTIHMKDGSSSSLTITRDGDKYVISKQISEEVVAQFESLGVIEKWSEFMRPQERDLLYGVWKISDYFPFDSIAFDTNGMRVFRISPRQARGAGTPSVSGELGKYGENLPSALDYMITHDQVGFEQLQLWIRGVIPDLDYLKSDYTEIKQLGLFLQEYGVGAPWYAEDLSDGTLMSIALFMAILDNRNRCVFIEEPENSLHPWILRKFLDCCRQVSDKRQILISTQSPIVVATATPENLFLIEKREGRTNISNALAVEPNLNNIIKTDFLDMGEYWLSGGLRGVPEPPSVSGNLFTTNREDKAR